jgi:hypothetical protein
VTAGPGDLTPAQAQAFLRDHVTVVRPGETLVVRGGDWAPYRVRELQEALDTMIAARGLKFSVLVVPGDELAVAQADTDAAFAERVAAALHQNALRGRFPMRPR